MTDIQAATESIVAATSHPVSVQLINQGAGIWGNVATGLITGLLTGGITLTGIWLTHYFTLKRERQASEDKMKRNCITLPPSWYSCLNGMLRVVSGL